MTSAEQQRLAERADAIHRAMHMSISDAKDPTDVVLVIDGAPRTWTLSAEDAPIALCELGGLALVFAVADHARGLAPDRLVMVIMIGPWVQVTDIGIRRLDCGGDAE